MFRHDYPFDPTHGYDQTRLLAVSPPPEPPDFEDFWQNLYRKVELIDIAPSLREIPSGLPGTRVYEVEFTSYLGFRVKGWLTAPRHQAVERGLVIGHGYGGRDGPDPLTIPGAAAIFPCCRGLGRSAVDYISSNPQYHVIHDLQDRDRYLLQYCVFDTWCAASALLQLFPQAGQRLDYQGTSFGGGIGALALAWDPRFHKAQLTVPSFGHHPLRLQMPCVGSGEAVRRFEAEHGRTLATLAYYDAASAAHHIRIPTHVAPALFDPAVPPPGQFAIYNAIEAPKQLFVLSAGHFDWPRRAREEQRLHESILAFLDDP